MHELGLARSVLAIVLEAAAGATVTAVSLEVGTLTGVVESSLQHSFSLLAVDTAAGQARLVVRPCPPLATCSACGRSEHAGLLPLQLRCDGCGGTLVLVGGRQLEIVTIEVEDVDNGAHTQGDPER